MSLYEVSDLFKAVSRVWGLSYPYGYNSQVWCCVVFVSVYSRTSGLVLQVHLSCEVSDLFVHVHPRIWCLWSACHCNNQCMSYFSWVYAKNVSSLSCLWFYEPGCEVSCLFVGICLIVWGLQGVLGFISHGVKSLICLQVCLLGYEIYDLFLSLHVSGYAVCDCLSLYIPECEVSYMGGCI